jgi:hypothetical protein
MGAYIVELFGSDSHYVLEALCLLMDVADEHALEFFILICQMFVKTRKTVNATLNLAKQQVGWSRFRIPIRGKRFFSPPKRADRLWSPFSLLLNQ